jgi:hypothetical protein
MAKLLSNSTPNNAAPDVATTLEAADEPLTPPDDEATAPPEDVKFAELELVDVLMGLR